MDDAMHDALSTLKQIGTPRVLVIGDVMLDRYVWGDAQRISPEAPVPVVRSDFDEVRPGGAASVAYLLRGLDAEVTLCGAIGGDANGRTLRKLLEECGIEESLIVEECRVTTCKERIIGRSSNHPYQLVRVDREEDRPISRSIEDRLVAAIDDRLESSDVVLISDYRKGACSRRLLGRAISAASSRGIPVLVDPGHGADYARYQRAQLLKPNRIEAQIASGVTIRCSSDALTAGRLLCQRSRVESVLVTLDAEGMAFVPAGGKGKLITTRPRNVHDVTGAGDMALAMLGLCRAAGIASFDAARLANVAAGLEVERFGVAPITRAEIREQIAGGGRKCAGKVVSMNELLAAIEAHRRAGRRIVFTNGCFDLFHVGHLRCLEEAAALGDVLIVAVNSDASVRRLKGAGRPVVGQHDRAAIIAALGCVDYVTIFGADTPHRLLQVIKPDVLAKGGTSQSDRVVGREVVAGQGGQVHLTGETRGVSTTRILEQIQTRTCK